jgi:hypothetical protein
VRRFSLQNDYIDFVSIALARTKQIFFWSKEVKVQEDDALGR